MKAIDSRLQQSTPKVKSSYVTHTSHTNHIILYSSSSLSVANSNFDLALRCSRIIRIVLTVRLDSLFTIGH